MENHGSITFKVDLISGYDITIDKLSSYVNSLMSEIVVLVASPTSYEIIGKKIRENIPVKDISFAMVKGRASLASAEDFASKCKDDKRALIVGVGGGSVIDFSKYVAWRCRAPLTIIPTVLSSNALASPFSVLELEDKRIATFRTKEPDLIVADFSILENQPKRFVLSGLGDLLAKYTSIQDYIYSSLIEKGVYNRVAVVLAESLLKVAIDNATLIASSRRDGIELLLHLLILDGYLMNLAETTRIVAGCEHLIAYGIEKVSGKGLHGEQVAIGTLICSFLGNKDWATLKELFSKIGLPTKASQLGLSSEEMKKALIIAPETRDWFTILGKKKLKEEIANTILTELEITL